MFWERFYELCIKNNTKPNPIAKEIGISSGIITKWKAGSIPNGEMLIKIADYLDCSVDYLLGRTDNPEVNRLPEEEYLLLAGRGGKKLVQAERTKIIEALKEDSAKDNELPPDLV